MADLCLSARDGWHEVDDFSGDADAAKYVGAGDWLSVEAVLQEQGIVLAKPGTDGDEPHEGSIEFTYVRQPDDILGWHDRLWFRCSHPVEIVTFDTDQW